MTVPQIVAELNRCGEKSATGRPHTMHTISWIRWKNAIPGPSLKRPEELTVQELAVRLGVQPGPVYYWVKRGMIEGRRLNNGAPVWITINESTLKELRDRVSRSKKMRKQPDVQKLAEQGAYEVTVPTLEDKVLQRAVVMILEPLYEQQFLDSSYGFRPGRSAHQALDALWQRIMPLSQCWLIGLDPLSWTHHCHKARCSTCRRKARDI